MKAIFEIKEDYNGMSGLMFQGAPDHFDAIDLNYDMSSSRFNPARLITHDLIEHNFKKDDGSVECELMAIGAAMFGRGNHGEVEVRGFENDIVSMARDSVLTLKSTLKGSKKFEPVEWIIDSLDMNKLINYIKSELDYAEQEINNSQIKSFIKLALRYIRQGARRAQKRFASSFNMYNMFDGMTNEIYRIGRYMEEFEQLIVEFCFKKLSYKVYTKSLYNDEY